MKNKYNFILQIAQGIQALHNKNILHRDLKPGNVMINSGVGTLKILDFGIAINTVSGSQAIPPAGTPLYMAPEQMAGELLTPKTDLFALAEIACVLFAGYHPFEAQNLNVRKTKIAEILTTYSFDQYNNTTIQ